MIINRNNVQSIVYKAGLNPDKDYGQNYLIDENIASKIVSSLSLNKNDHVLEIGPGIGSLTHFLCDSEATIHAVDIDKRMIDFLKVIYESKNLTLELNDIRKANVTKYNKIIGNLPYNITTELIIYLLQNATKAKKMVLMCQKEAFSRFSDMSGKNYGPASIFIHLLGTIKRLFIVKPGSFYPCPKCDSVVFEINIAPNFLFDDIIGTYQLSKMLFANRRKNIFNNLMNVLKDKVLAKNVLDRLSIQANSRSEEISYNVFFEMYLVIRDSGKLLK